jgi:hypothetical protein
VGLLDYNSKDHFSGRDRTPCVSSLANQLRARPFDPFIKLVHMKEPKQLSVVETWRFPCVLQLRGQPKDNQSRRTSPLKLKVL